jgi:hypothetical protein
MFAAVHLPPNGSGGLIFGDGSDNPILACLDALLGQQDASQPHLHYPTETQTAGAISDKQRWVANCLYASLPFEVLD